MPPRATRIALHGHDLARTRFVRSLLFETLQATGVLVHAEKQLHHRYWLQSVDPAAARARLPLLLALYPRIGWVPDFLAPPPQSAGRSIDDELAVVAGHPITQVAADLRRSLHSQPTRVRTAVLAPLIDDPAAGLAQVLTELRWAWDHLVEPFWAPVHDLVDADIAFRSQVIAQVGLGRVLTELHSGVSFADGAVTVLPGEGIDLDLAGRGLLLLPSAFVWPRVVVVHEAPWPPTLVYPARGVGELWSAPPRPPAALAAVLGETRALLLADLGEPATTTALAARHGLSAAAVSGQLRRLTEAGLLSSRRHGKEVRYRRTRTGDALLRPSG